MRYRKRPMEVEAEIFRADEPHPEVKYDRIAAEYYVEGDGKNQPMRMVIRDGDWIVRGESGTYYGCRHDDFLRIYEPISP